MNKLKKILFISFLFLSINILFYPSAWKQIINPESEKILISQGETHVYELVAESVYKNIINGKNPFSQIDTVLYPLGWNFAPDDVAPINGLWFVFLRTFLSIHQSFMLITVLSIYLTNISMYYLLRLLGRSQISSFLASLILGFTPFVSYRIWGHPTYVALYIFVIPAIFMIQLIKKNSTSKKLLFSLGLSLSFTISVLTNLYFTVMLGILMFLYFIFALIFENKKTIFFIKNSFLYILTTIISTIFLNFPWLIKVYDSFQLNGVPPQTPPTDSILLSADIISLFWPANNPYYQPLLNYFSNIWSITFLFETFMYPGIILIISILFYITIIKKLPNHLKILFSVGVVFFILTLGPNLKILGHTTNIPLPYFFLRKIPLLEMARAPARFVVCIIFSFSIILAFVFDYILNKKYISKYLFIFLFILIFFVDQKVSPMFELKTQLPSKIYQFLYRQPSQPLLEIPFVIRDSIKYFGFKNRVWPQRAIVFHNMPLFSIYSGRVPDDMFYYFQNSPLFGSLGNLVMAEPKEQEQIIKNIDVESSKKMLDFYNVSYSLVKNDESFTPNANKLMRLFAFSPKITDSKYTLWYRNIETQSDNFIFTNSGFNPTHGFGWSAKENDGFWALNPLTRVFMPKINKALFLTIKAHSLAIPQSVKIFINEQKLDEVELTRENKTFNIPILNGSLKQINVITFKFSNSAIPIKYILNSQDGRSLYAFFTEVAFKF